VSDDLDKLTAKVELMRKLGITECDGIKLGAPILPKPPEETEEEQTARLNKDIARRHQIMFAHSATRPKLRVLK